MKKIILSSILILCSGCAELSKLKVSEDGTYRFIDAPFKVTAPDQCLLDMFVYDDESSVVFTTGRGYWMASGEYGVTIFPLPESVNSNDSFIEESKRVYTDIMKEDGRKILNEEVLDINGRKVLQAVSTNSNEDTMVHTHIYFPNNIVLATLRYPVKDLQGKPAVVPWECYNKFIASIAPTPEA